MVMIVVNINIQLILLEQTEATSCQSIILILMVNMKFISCSMEYRLSEDLAEVLKDLLCLPAIEMEIIFILLVTIKAIQIILQLVEIQLLLVHLDHL